MNIIPSTLKLLQGITINEVLEFGSALLYLRWPMGVVARYRMICLALRSIEAVTCLVLCLRSLKGGYYST